MYVVDPKSLPTLGIPNGGYKILLYYRCFIFLTNFIWLLGFLACNTCIIKDYWEK
jgi:hypothetical protein